jgi:hypothetical protein
MPSFIGQHITLQLSRLPVLEFSCLIKSFFFVFCLCRFHLLAEFDADKRSCRKRLDGHNRRRRKPQPDTMASASFIASQQGHFRTHQFCFGFFSPQVCTWFEYIYIVSILLVLDKEKVKRQNRSVHT